MEVIQCSGGHHVGETDCTQQGSGTDFMYDHESNGIKPNEQVRIADVKMDSVMPTVEEPQKERVGGGQWVVDEFPNLDSQHADAGNSFSDFEGDVQKLSYDSHDSEDDHRNALNHFIGPGETSENVHIVVDTIDNVAQGSTREGESISSHTVWLDEDEPMAVWVKWRGKWQAGIRCARVDCPLSTLRAKPTHDRKKYLVIFFPRTRNYSWADVQLVRPINEFPQPIAYRTHKTGAKMVQDLALAHRFILQKLAIGMLNVLDQLHSEVVIETARDVVAWKEFGVEASHCKGYSDLGEMLLKLQNMILKRCLSPSWLQNGLPAWEQQCKNALSAETVELLKEELVNSILWNEVNALMDLDTQPDFVSEWKTWKLELMKSFSISNPVSGFGDTENPTRDSVCSVGIQNSRKRPKLEVRRAEAHPSQVETQVSCQPMTLQIDSLFSDGLDVNTTASELGPSANEILLEEAISPSSCGKVVDRWDGIVVKAENAEVTKNQDDKLTIQNVVDMKKPVDSSNKNRQCVAFIEAKGRQCVRQANDGDIYCCVHLASRFVVNSAKTEVSPPVEAAMCEGTTVLGTKCKHRSLHGSPFCKKHRPKDDIGMTFRSARKNKIKHENSINRSHTTNCKEIVLVGEVEAPLHVEPISFAVDAVNCGGLLQMPDQSGKMSTTETPHCMGPCLQDGSEPCLESPKKCSLYCERHLPSWLKRARNGKSRIISKEVFLNLVSDCSSYEQKVRLHQACELFYKLFKSILSLRNPVPKEVQFQWAISEASKDVRVGEYLMKLVCSEKERLRQLWGFSADKATQVSSSAERPVPLIMANAYDFDNENVISCKICSENFPDDHSLGTHFMDNHKKEAQWLFRGYVCAICLDSFTNKKLLEMHVQERHHVQFVEQCMLLQCIPCGSHFGNTEQLWLHVLAVHSASFKLQNTSQEHITPVEASSQKSEPQNLTLGENVNSENQNSIRKFICRFCGLKFDLLPDLGRHHQAAHMGPSSMSSRLPKRGARFYSYRLKSGRLTRPKFKRGLGTTTFKIRNRGSTNSSLKKCIQASNIVSNEEMKLQPHVAEVDSLGKMEESQCSAIAKLLFSEIKKTKLRPSGSEILSIAKSACCKVSLQASLMEKFRLLPERVYLKAAKLCSENNIVVEWHQEGYVCPKGCKSVANSPLRSPLMPLSDEAVRSRSMIDSDSGMKDWELDECHCIVDHFRPEIFEKSIVLCDDISFGLESVSIACVVDENLLGSLHVPVDCSDGQICVYPWESFTYVTKPLFDQSLGIAAEQSLQLGCTCSHSACTSENCDHVYLFDNDYEDAKDIYGNAMHGRFPYDDRGRVILEEGYLVYECNNRCSCSKSCPNRVLQNGIRVKLEVFKTENKGWAVRAGAAIMRGTFVCEYIGEVIDEQEANNRRNRYEREDCTYFFDIDAHNNDMSRLIEGQTPYVIDATVYGNVSRYINHSCSPNLVNHQVLVESMDYQLAHIGLFASRDIAVGEELTYDYRYKLLPGEGCLCLCGCSNCRGRLF